MGWFSNNELNNDNHSITITISEQTVLIVLLLICVIVIWFIKFVLKYNRIKIMDNVNLRANLNNA